jgi:acyl carrier protein
MCSPSATASPPYRETWRSNERLEPAPSGLSVHNAIAGPWSILRGHRAAQCAGDHTGIHHDLAMNALQRDIAQLIIDSFNLDRLQATDISAAQALPGQGLGPLGLALALQNHYNLQIASDSRDARQHLATVASLATFNEAPQAACAS